MRVPLAGSTSTSTPDLDGARARHAPRDDRHRGRPHARARRARRRRELRRRQRAHRRAAPRRRPAQRLHASTSARASRSRSSAARRTSPRARPSRVARPGAVMPDGTKLGKAKLRGVVSNGMILAEDELALGTDHAGIVVLDERRSRPARRWPTCCAIRDDVLELEITPNRPGLPQRLRRRARGPRGHRRAAGAAAVGRRPGRGRRRRAPPGSRSRSRTPTSARASPARVFEDVTIGPVAAVAQGAPHGRRPAADQQRRRHHELRDAADGPAAARVRPRPHRRRAARSCAARTDGETDHDARRPGAHARPAHAASSPTPTARRRSPA